MISWQKDINVQKLSIYITWTMFLLLKHCFSSSNAIGILGPNAGINTVKVFKVMG